MLAIYDIAFVCLIGVRKEYKIMARVSSIIFSTKRRLHLQIDRTGDITELTRRVQTLQETIASTVRVSIPCTELIIHI